MKNMYRQGDVLLIPAADDTSNAAAGPLDPAPQDPRGLVLAEGESSGHFHAVFGSGAKLFRFRDTSGQMLLVTGKKGANVRVVGGGSGGVARHEPIHIEPGRYVVRVQRSWTTSHIARRVED